MRYGNIRRLITFAGYREPNDGIALVGVSRRVSDKKKQNRAQILYRHLSASTHTNKLTQCAHSSFLSRFFCLRLIYACRFASKDTRLEKKYLSILHRIDAIYVSLHRIYILIRLLWRPAAHRSSSRDGSRDRNIYCTTIARFR